MKFLGNLPSCRVGESSFICLYSMPSLPSPRTPIYPKTERFCLSLHLCRRGCKDPQEITQNILPCFIQKQLYQNHSEVSDWRDGFWAWKPCLFFRAKPIDIIKKRHIFLVFSILTCLGHHNCNNTAVKPLPKAAYSEYSFCEHTRDFYSSI